jgi:hypothetical protein
MAVIARIEPMLRTYIADWVTHKSAENELLVHYNLEEILYFAMEVTPCRREAPEMNEYKVTKM